MSLQTDKLSTYTPTTYPRSDDGLPTYITGELQDISLAISLIVQVMKQLEARLVAGGL